MADESSQKQGVVLLLHRLQRFRKKALSADVGSFVRICGSFGKLLEDRFEELPGGLACECDRNDSFRCDIMPRPKLQRHQTNVAVRKLVGFPRTSRCENDFVG